MKNKAVYCITFLFVIMFIVLGFGQQTPSDSLRSADRDTTYREQPADSIREPDSTKAVIEKSLDLEIDGLVVDETQTKLGRDFYDIFYSRWEAPLRVTDYTIVISEKPLPRLGTQVSINVNETLVFQRFLQPRYEAIEEFALQGIRIVLIYLHQYEQTKHDLESGDMQGSGIF